MERTLEVDARENGGFIRTNLPRLIIISVLGVIMLSTVILAVLLTQYIDFTSQSSDTDPDDSPNPDLIFINKARWGASPPDGTINKLNITPVPYVIISHTASDVCDTEMDCTQRVRLTQMTHVEINKWLDISYNFLIGGKSFVYVGRGWDSEGGHMSGFNSRSIGIAMIGTFNLIKPSKQQLHSLAELIALGVKKNKIRDDYKLLGESQVAATLSPGIVLYDVIAHWDHWSEKP